MSSTNFIYKSVISVSMISCHVSSAGQSIPSPVSNHTQPFIELTSHKHHPRSWAGLKFKLQGHERGKYTFEISTSGA